MKNKIKSVFTEYRDHPDKLYLFIFSILGLLVSVYLAYAYSQNSEINCTLSNCEAVRQSQYSSFLGISVPILGILFYFLIFAYSTLIILKKSNYILFIKEIFVFFTFCTIGFGFSVYLTLIEAFVIEVFCQWCLLSALITTIIFIISIYRTKLENL